MPHLVGWAGQTDLRNKENKAWEADRLEDDKESFCWGRIVKPMGPL